MRYIILVCCLIPGLVWASDTIEPGLYETTVTTKMKMGDMQMPARTITQTNCITAEDAANGPPLPEPDDAECEVIKYEFGSGELDMEMVCQIQGGQGRMVGSGSYSDDTYEMNNRFSMNAQGMQMELQSVAAGHRVSDC